MGSTKTEQSGMYPLALVSMKADAREGIEQRRDYLHTLFIHYPSKAVVAKLWQAYYKVSPMLQPQVLF